MYSLMTLSVCFNLLYKLRYKIQLKPYTDFYMLYEPIIYFYDLEPPNHPITTYSVISIKQILLTNKVHCYTHVSFVLCVAPRIPCTESPIRKYRDSSCPLHTQAGIGNYPNRSRR